MLPLKPSELNLDGASPKVAIVCLRYLGEKESPTDSLLAESLLSLEKSHLLLSVCDDLRALDSLPLLEQTLLVSPSVLRHNKAPPTTATRSSTRNLVASGVSIELNLNNLI